MHFLILSMPRRVFRFIHIGDTSLKQNLKPTFEHPDDVGGEAYYEIPYKGRKTLVTFRETPGGSELDEDAVRRRIAEERRVLYFEGIVDKFRQVDSVLPPMGGINSGALRVMKAERMKINLQDPLAMRLEGFIESAADYSRVQGELDAMPLGEIARFSSIIGIFYESDMGERILSRIRTKKTYEELFRDLHRWNGQCLMRLGEVIPESVSDLPLKRGLLQPVVRGLLSKHSYDILALPGVPEMGSRPDMYTKKSNADTRLFLGKGEEKVLGNISVFAAVLRENFIQRAKVTKGSNPIEEDENTMLAHGNTPLQFAERYAHKWVRLNEEWVRTGTPRDVLSGVGDVCEFLVCHRWNPFLGEGYESAVNSRWIFSDARVCLSTKPALIKTVSELNDDLNRFESATEDERSRLLRECSSRLKSGLAVLRPALMRDIESNELEIRGVEESGDYTPHASLLSAFNDNAHFIANGITPLIQHPEASFRLMRAWRENAEIFKP